MAWVWDFFAHEDDYPDLDADGACERLGRALAIPTVGGPDRDSTDWVPFDRLEELMRVCYPRLFSTARVEHVDHSLMLTLEGSDGLLDPVLLMGHMDVVGVVAGTEDDWTHGAFSGDVDDEYVWGRGALDMTCQVMGDLEAVEYLLAHGARPRRTLLVCLGQDEETCQTGARAMGELLERRGIRVWLLLDEGSNTLLDLAPYGAPGHYALPVGVAEKGYADVTLTVRGAGGHSSNPYGGTSLGTLARAIARVAEAPRRPALVEPVRGTVETVAPLVTEGPYAPLVADGAPAVAANADRIARLMADDPAFMPEVETTVAPTMVVGSSPQPNVMPQDMTATINFRVLPGDSVEAVIGRVREAVAGLPVEVGVVEESANDPSGISDAHGTAFAALAHAAGRYFADPSTGEPLTLLPRIERGATDARMYERVCDACLRLSPFVADPAEAARGIHGTDERITRRAYAQGIRMVTRLLQETIL